MQYFGFDRPSFGIKTFGFGDNFDPLDLFKDGEQGVWFDPSDKTTLFQDVAGTVPVTKDGDPVALMRDKSGNNNHATQTVSTARPIYKTDGILHWLETDGIDDYLEVPSIGDFTTKIVSQYIATNVKAHNGCITAQTDSFAQRRLLISYTNGPTITTGFYTTTVNPAVWLTKSTVNPSFGLKASIINSIMDAPNLVIEGRLNNILMDGSSQPSSAPTKGSYIIGNRGDGNSMCKMSLYGLIRTDTDIKPLDNTLFKTNDYLANKSGVTL